MTERLGLVSFLLQLRPHFPSWKGEYRGVNFFDIALLISQLVLTWDVIIETLMDDDFVQGGDADERAIAAHLVR